VVGGLIFSRGKFNVTPKVGSNAVICSSRADAVIDCFAAYTAAVTPNAFQRAGQVGTTPKHCPFPLGFWTAIDNTWFLWPTQVTHPKGLSIGSAIFAGLTNATNRQTNHATPSVAIGRI